MSNEHKWETVCLTQSSAMERMQVPGGWIYVLTIGANQFSNFVPDPAIWAGESEQEVAESLQ